MHNQDTSVSLRQQIRELINTTSLTDPHEVAAKLVESATAEDRELWLMDATVAVCAEVMRTERNASIADMRGRESRRTPSKSAKVAGIRDHWARFCAARIPVDGRWTTVGALDAESLPLVIEERRRQAAAMSAQADLYERLLSLVVQHKARSVSALPAKARAEFVEAGVA